VILDERGHDPGGDVIEVYDHPQPAARIKDVPTIEALAARTWIALAEVRTLDCCQDHGNVIEEPRSRSQRQMQVCACVKDDLPAIGIVNRSRVSRHRLNVGAIAVSLTSQVHQA
jgi:hypothetical protein